MDYSQKCFAIFCRNQEKTMIMKKSNFQKGYDAAWQEISERDKSLLFSYSACEETFYLNRLEFMELAARREPYQPKRFKKYLDTTFFAKGIPPTYNDDSLTFRRMVFSL